MNDDHNSPILLGRSFLRKTKIHVHASILFRKVDSKIVNFNNYDNNPVCSLDVIDSKV